MVPGREDVDWLMPWIEGIGSAVWVSDLRGTIAFLNARAEELLGCTAADGEGTPCHRLVCGEDHGGLPVCRPECAILHKASRGAEIEPVFFRLGGTRDQKRWISVLAFVPPPPEGVEPCLVHIAYDVDRPRRAEEYLAKVAARSEGPLSGAQPPLSVLSTRELEVLELLAADEDPASIARRLFVSHATVRNHVQHLLAKLAVHSVQEAVARYVLERGP